MFRTIAVFLVSLCLFAAPEATSGQTPAKLELAQNWKLVAAEDVPADGGALSQPAYEDRKWLPIHRMPATNSRTKARRVRFHVNSWNPLTQAFKRQ